jgi:hypothetical protein
MASATLRIRLLGEPDLRSGEVTMAPLGSTRAESLLAYLLLHREAAQPRQRLAFLLWPDSSEAQARTNLRHLLHTLRRALPEPDRFLEVTPRTLRWRADAPCWLDVAAFEDALARAEREPGAHEVPALAEADWALGRHDNVRTWESEARRRRGESLAALGAPDDEVEAELQRALGIARRQGAKLFELRAAASLLRRRLDGGDGRSLRQAGELLGAIVDAVPEGRDTPDLREAATLLDRG